MKYVLATISVLIFLLVGGVVATTKDLFLLNTPMVISLICLTLLGVFGLNESFKK